MSCSDVQIFAYRNLLITKEKRLRWTCHLAKSPQIFCNCAPSRNSCVLELIGHFPACTEIDGIHGAHRSLLRLDSTGDKHPDRDLGFDDGGQAVLAINQFIVIVKRDSLVGRDPISGAHVVRARANRAFTKSSVVSVFREVSSGLFRSDFLPYNCRLFWCFHSGQ
jgi:hypothetical protein